VDCFAVDVPGSVGFSQYLEAFYTSRTFKLERLILGLLFRKPSTDQQASQLAMGQISQFSAWTQEARAENQIIMCDWQQITRSCLMTVDNGDTTTLYFGTIIVPKRRAEGRGEKMAPLFKLTLGAHLLYSRILLRSAVARLARSGHL
jgi:hypothetical protein